MGWGTLFSENAYLSGGGVYVSGGGVLAAATSASIGGREGGVGAAACSSPFVHQNK